MWPGRLRLNHYQTLGVGFRANSMEIKTSYHELAKKFHPDQNPNDPEADTRFRQIKEAYECLSSKLRRAEYDQDLLRSGRARWMVQNSHKTNFEPEDMTGTLSRRDVGVFAFLIAAFPLVAVWLRTSRSADFKGDDGSPPSWGSPAEIPKPSTTDELVRAYFNPLTQRWERLKAGQSPPNPLALFQYVVRDQRGLFLSFARNGGSMPAKDDRFYVHEVPQRLTAEPLWDELMDMKVEVS